MNQSDETETGQTPGYIGSASYSAGIDTSKVSGNTEDLTAFNTARGEQQKAKGGWSEPMATFHRISVPVHLISGVEVLDGDTLVKIHTHGGETIKSSDPEVVKAVIAYYDMPASAKKD